jgi:transaldolase
VNRLRHLEDAGVSIWLDDLSRELIDSGEFMRLVQKRSVTGATSNPTIFAKAISGSGRYDRQLRLALESGVRDPREIFFELALEDVRRAADSLRAAYDLSDGRTGFVSFECTPDLANDAEATVRQALEVSDRLDVPNALIKVAATDAGIQAIQELTAHGVSVNVTLLFSVERYTQAIGAYWNGLTRRAAAGESLSHITSVASFFVSRVDAAVDPWLAPDSPLLGRIAIANAQLAYARYRESLNTPRWEALAAQGARPQRPLWASTATKNPDYSDVRYVEELVAPGVINTMPLATLDAFADHGDVGGSLGADGASAERLLEELAGTDVKFAALTDALEQEGVESFRESYRQVLSLIEESAARLQADEDRNPSDSRHVRAALNRRG